MALFDSSDVVVTPMDVISRDDFRDGLIAAMEESGQVGPFRRFLIRRRLYNPRILERVYAKAMEDAPNDIVKDGKPDWQRFFEWLIENLPKILALIAMFA